MVYPDGAFAELMGRLDAPDQTTALGYHRESWRGIRYYHRDGLRFEAVAAVPERPLGGLSKLLTPIYNPHIKVRYEFGPGVAYDLEELKRGVAAAIRADDDNLTQFHDAEDLLAELERATEFDHVAAVLIRAYADPGH